VQADFLAAFLPQVRRLGRAVYLETNGVLADEFKRLHRYIDVVAMDIKLPSATKHPPVWAAHRAFMAAVCLCGQPGFIKLVLTPDCTAGELARLKRLLAESTRAWTVVLQPEHSMVHRSKLWDRMQQWQDGLMKVASDVRVIPQVHKLIGLK
jgi:organic radical activating enzyme